MNYKIYSNKNKTKN